MFGPVQQSPNMALAQQDGDWRFQLDKPLTREDADAVIVFQQKLQWALDRITQWLEGRESPPELALEEAFAAALAGEELNLEGIGEAEPSGEEQPRPGA